MVSIADLQILRYEDMCKTFRVHKSTIYRWKQSGILPPPIHVGPNVVGWPAYVVREILERQASDVHQG